MEWTPSKIDQLIAWWAEGRDASWIGAQWHVSRSTILGKIHRLRGKDPDLFARRMAPAKPAKKLKAKRKQRYRKDPVEKPVVTHVAAPKPKPKPKPRAPGPVTLMELTPAHCRYPIGEVRAEHTVFCGLRIGKGSYCAEHAARCYSGAHYRAPSPY